jgi:hypothetical protein
MSMPKAPQSGVVSPNIGQVIGSADLGFDDGAPLRDRTADDPADVADDHQLDSSDLFPAPRPDILVLGAPLGRTT